MRLARGKHGLPWTLIASVIACVAVWAQPADVLDSFAIVDVRIVVGDGRVLEKGTVLIRDGLIQAAQILGVGDLLGSLEPGKLASLIVTDGDPLEVTTSLHHLFIAGKPIPLESKQTRLYQLYQRRLAPTLAPSAERRGAGLGR